jgi:hypothetical protein
MHNRKTDDFSKTNKKYIFYIYHFWQNKRIVTEMMWSTNQVKDFRNLSSEHDFWLLNAQEAYASVSVRSLRCGFYRTVKFEEELYWTHGVRFVCPNSRLNRFAVR